MAIWRDPTRRGGELLDSVLTAEGLDPGDPAALLRGRDALTNAMTWIWRQADWEWAVSPNSPVRFRVPAFTHVVVDTLIPQTAPFLIVVAGSEGFIAGDNIVVAEGASKEEWLIVQAVDPVGEGTALDFELLAGPSQTHTAAERALIRKVRPIVSDPVIRTISRGAGFQRSVINVQSVLNFRIDDLIVLDPEGTQRAIARIKEIEPALNSFVIKGNLGPGNPTGRDVHKCVETDETFNLAVLTGGRLADFGRSLSLAVEGEGPLVPMNADVRAARRGRTREANLRGGDHYVIEGDPPTLKFDIVPVGPKTLVMHYLRAPTRFFGDDDVPLPYPFQSLLVWAARILLRKDGPPGAVLRSESDVVSEVNRLKSFSVNADHVFEMRS